MKLEITTTAKRVETVNYILGQAINALKESSKTMEAFELTEKEVEDADKFRKHLIDIYLKPQTKKPVADTEANAINILLTAGAYLGSLVGKEVSVEPGFIYEMRGFQLNENGSGMLYGKNGLCTFGSYKSVRPCR